MIWWCSDTVIGKVQLKGNYVASICKNYHRETAHQGSPKQLVQNVTVRFSTKLPRTFLTEVLQEICLMLAFSICVLRNVLHTLHISLLVISIFCKAEWKYSDLKFCDYLHILNYFRVWLSNCNRWQSQRQLWMLFISKD